MNPENLKEYLQYYLDSIVTPKVNEKRNELGISEIKFDVYQIVKGSFEPLRYHIFLDTEPQIKKKSGLKPHVIMMMDGVQKDINNFFKVLSINSPTKVHWNKRPIFKNDTLHTED